MRQASRVIQGTGPNMDYTRVGSPMLDSLFKQGLIMPGPCGPTKGALCVRQMARSHRCYSWRPGGRPSERH